MCMSCFNTIEQISKQKYELKKIRERDSICETCKDFTLDKDFEVFGKCALDGHYKGKYHVCEYWKKRS